MYNLIKLRNFDQGNLCQFKRDESPVRAAGNPEDVSTANPSYFKYKSSFIKESTAVNNDRAFKNIKIAESGL